MENQANPNDMFSALAEHKVQNTTIVVGATAAGTPQDALVNATGAIGTWMSTHGVGVISYLEIFQVIGAFGVLIASINIIVNWIKSIRG